MPDRTRAKILLVDDNRQIHDDFRKILIGSDDAESISDLESEIFGASGVPARRALTTFEVDSAYRGEEALDLVQQSQAEKDPYSVAFVDMRMPPGWDGLETIEHLWNVAPDLQVVICSAYSDYSWSEILQRLARQDGLLVLKKPFDSIEVLQMALALSTKWRLHQEAKKRLDELAGLVAAKTRDLLDANDTLRLEIKRRTEAEGQLVEAQKLEGLGRMAAGIAHEINNPMAFVASNIESLDRDLRNARKGIPPELQEYVDEILPATLDGIERINAIVADVRRFARSDVELPVAFDLNSEVAAALRIVQCRATSKHLIEARLGPVAMLRGRPSHVGQLVINLVVNAIQAMPEGGRIELTTRQLDGDAILEVRDDGPGMSADVRRTLFQPFFTTKPPGQGTGLGLAVCHGIAKSHGGAIEVQTAPGKGTCFRVRLPLNPAPALAAVPPLAKCG